MSRAAVSDGFGIGTVAGLTGVDVHTIRAWERRHRAIVPDRAPSGHRRYGESHIRRLRLLRSGIELGDTIRSLAPLDDDALRERIATLAPAPSPHEETPGGVALVGSNLREQWAGAGASPLTAP